MNNVDIFTAQDALNMSSQSIAESNKLNVEIYNQIIRCIKEAAKKGKTMIHLNNGDMLEKECTPRTISKLKSNGFKVKRATLPQSLYETKYLGLEISWN